MMMKGLFLGLISYPKDIHSIQGDQPSQFAQDCAGFSTESPFLGKPSVPGKLRLLVTLIPQIFTENLLWVRP